MAVGQASFGGYTAGLRVRFVSFLTKSLFLKLRNESVHYGLGVEGRSLFALKPRSAKLQRGVVYRVGLIVLLVSALLGGCVASEQADSVAASVVYGQDDRREVYQHSNDLMRTRALESSLALISQSTLVEQPDGSFKVSAATLQEAVNLCEDERFGNQPTAARCSGVVIDRDLVLTAGHCVVSESQCRSFAFVFDYRIEESGLLASIHKDDVYECARIAVRDQASGFQNTPDFAVIQLDRALETGKVAAPIRFSALSMGDSVTMIGHGTGLPVKIDSGGTVVNPRTNELDFFTASADAFGGHSGSGVFDDAGDLVGILVAGREPDYVMPEGQSCVRVNEFDNSEGDEAIHYMLSIIEALCSSGWQSDTLCGDTCIGPECPPDEWTCNIDWYGAGDKCDCACGAYDPDCDDKNLQIAGCGAFQVCGLSAKCEIPTSNTLVGSCATHLDTDKRPVWLFVLVASLAIWRRRR